MMCAGADWRSEDNATRIMGVDRLRHPDTPKTIDGVRTVNIFAAWRRIEHILAAAGEIERATKVSDCRCPIPNNVNAPIIARTDPGEHVIVQNAIGRARCLDRYRRRPGISLV